MLTGAGFVRIEWETVNERWLPYVDGRLTLFRSESAQVRNTRVHGPTLVAELDRFYTAVHGLFTRGNLGGVRIKAYKADV